MLEVGDYINADLLSLKCLPNIKHKLIGIGSAS